MKRDTKTKKEDRIDKNIVNTMEVKKGNLSLTPCCHHMWTGFIVPPNFLFLSLANNFFLCVLPLLLELISHMHYYIVNAW